MLYHTNFIKKKPNLCYYDLQTFFKSPLFRNKQSENVEESSYKQSLGSVGLPATSKKERRKKDGTNGISGVNSAKKSDKQ